jgi:transposase
MEGNRRNYSEEFKRDAVGHSLTSEKTVAEVAQDLGIAHSNLKEMESLISQQRGTDLPRKWQTKAHPPKKKRSEGQKKSFMMSKGARYIKKSCGHLLKKNHIPP